MFSRNTFHVRLLSFCMVIFLWSAGIVADNLFKEPESVVFDYELNRYFVSNADDGKIIEIDSSGVETIYNETLSSCRGLHIHGMYLYGAGTEGIVEINLETGELNHLIEIEGRTFLNDVTSDTLDYLYVSDSSQGKIYKIRLDDYSYTDFSTGLTGINGILYVMDLNLLYFCTGRDIKKVSLIDSSVTQVIRTYHSQLDGLAIDSTGFIYFSSWGSDGVFRYDPLFSLEEADTVSVGHTDPADIYYNTRDNILCVPNFNANTVDFVEMILTSVPDEETANVPEGYGLYQNYPNPFNPITTIHFRIPKNEWVSVEIYNITGQKVASLINEFVQAGLHTVTWDANSYSSGVYLYKIKAGPYAEMKKMILVK